MKRISLAFLCLAFAQSPAFGVEIYCPPSIEGVVGLPQVPTGWKLKAAPDDANVKLTGMSLFDVIGSERAMLKPSKIVDKYNASWEFLQSSEADKGAAIIMQCAYAHTPFLIERELPPEVKFCDYSRSELGTVTARCISTGHSH